MYKYTYTYTLLRYVHDPIAEEFVNVGVVLYSHNGNYVGAKCRRNLGRLAKVFPGVDAKAFRSAMRTIESSFARLQKRMKSELAISSKKNALEIAQSVLPKDDSSLRWSDFRSGVSNDLQSTLESLFERLVAKYDEEQLKQRRTDDDVWRTFRTELKQRSLLSHFGPKTIRSQNDEVQFNHAWKNGAWHCFEALSFDLSAEDYIRSKAHRWLGSLYSVHDSPEPFKMYFLLAKPRERELSKAFESAVEILRKSPVPCEFYSEADVDKLSDEIERQLDVAGRA